MVAWMNAEALQLTLETGFVHYWSRSRQAIWKKGETSGALQRVVELRTDCDQDVLLVRAEVDEPRRHLPHRPRDLLLSQRPARRRADRAAVRARPTPTD